TKVMCSYSAISWPSTAGVRAGAMIEVVGRSPENSRAATRAPSVPSARTSSAVLPKASALVWAEVRQQQLVDVLLAVGQRVVGPGEGDEVRRDDPGALVDQLVEGVLAIGAGLAPEH